MTHPESQLSSGKIRVFIADDHPVVRSGIALLLNEQQDMQVVGESKDGRGAIDGINRLRPDVVLMDIDMPDISGLEVTSEVTRSWPETSVLILTGYDHEELLFQALRAGALGYLLKGTSTEELLKAVRTVHSGEAFIYPSMATKLVGDYIRHTNPSASKGHYQDLSTREREVLPLLAEGRTNEDIANLLYISPYTVQTYRQRIMKKLGLHGRTALVKYALEKGIIT